MLFLTQFDSAVRFLADTQCLLAIVVFLVVVMLVMMVTMVTMVIMVIMVMTMMNNTDWYKPVWIVSRLQKDV